MFQIFGGVSLCGARFGATLVLSRECVSKLGHVPSNKSRGEKCTGGVGGGEMRKIARDCSKHSVKMKRSLKELPVCTSQTIYSSLL